MLLFRWDRALWGDPTLPTPPSTRQHHHAEPPYGGEVWGRLLLPSGAQGQQGQAHWRQLLEGLGALYHFPLSLAGATATDESGMHTDAIAAANVVGGGGGGRVLPRLLARVGAFRLSLSDAVLGRSSGGGYRLLGASSNTSGHSSNNATLRYAHLPAPAGLCTDTWVRTLLGHGPSLLSPCRPREQGQGGGLGALLAVGLGSGGGRNDDRGKGDQLLGADYLSYVLELRRVCLQEEEGDDKRSVECLV